VSSHHIGIKHNERVDLLAKEAAIEGEPCNNYITSRELMTNLKLDYVKIDNPLGEEKAIVGAYYLNNFMNIKFKCKEDLWEEKELWKLK